MRLVIEAAVTLARNAIRHLPGDDHGWPAAELGQVDVDYVAAVHDIAWTRTKSSMIARSPASAVSNATP